MATKRLPNCSVCGHQKQPRQPCLNCIQVARREARLKAQEEDGSDEDVEMRLRQGDTLRAIHARVTADRIVDHMRDWQGTVLLNDHDQDVLNNAAHILYRISKSPR